ncbi:Hydrogenase/urease nickel incorporation protein HypA [Pelotomaculum schinkii]|uniref:Hydrogenase maturation factor HypA n=1 Tax=Pelotomaculum schinkii TaxID=78350 RepID=A0A4Y7R5R1_9FIRM|nr:hydrogenase maturation nickel metallochaperone HypA [Pelotomaculum schinkii]TEB04086.1 Hydrogenase/urease nickel incorporation protein HypA [Pelotomaculum schinkii]
MHEISVLYEVVKLAEEIAMKNNVKRIDSISIEVGELSGILPVFLEKYYPVVVENKEILKSSTLLIQNVPGEALCRECHSLYNVMKNEGKCPRCQSRNKTILGGREFVLKNIMFRESD